MSYGQDYRGGLGSLVNRLTDPGIVYVTGMTPYGHAVLRCNKSLTNDEALFAHVDQAGMNYPTFFMDFHDYITTQHKEIVAEQDVPVPNMVAARVRLNQLAQQTWLWGAAVHNCLSFCINVLVAGGANLTMIMHGAPLPLSQVQYVAPKWKGVGPQTMKSFFDDTGL